MKNIELNNGEVICKKCNGVGHTFIKTDDFHFDKQYCLTCRGTGKLDWVENVVGKKTLGPRVVIREVDLSEVIPSNLNDPLDKTWFLNYEPIKD